MLLSYGSVLSRSYVLDNRHKYRKLKQYFCPKIYLQLIYIALILYIWNGCHEHIAALVIYETKKYCWELLACVQTSPISFVARVQQRK